MEGAEGEGERISSRLDASEEPNRGLDPRTLRVCPEPKPGVRYH